MERGKIFFLRPRSTRLLCSPLTRALDLLSFMTVKKYKTLLALQQSGEYICNSDTGRQNNLVQYHKQDHKSKYLKQLELLIKQYNRKV